MNWQSMDGILDSIGPARFVPPAISDEIQKAFAGFDEAKFRIAMSHDFVGITLMKGVPYWLRTSAVEKMENLVMLADLDPVIARFNSALGLGCSSLRCGRIGFGDDLREGAVLT